MDWSSIRLVVLCVLTSCSIGCGSASDSPVGDSDGSLSQSDELPPTQPPDLLLQRVFARYRSAASYRDQAVVRLSFEKDSRRRSETAPLQVWFDRDMLLVRAYDVHLWSRPEALTAWIAEQPSDGLPGQILQVSSAPGRPRLDSLLSDPLLRQRLIAGLAGPPPQLEWLFAAKPMQRLFERTGSQPASDGDQDAPTDHHRVSYGRTRTIDTKQCQSVQVEAGGDQFVFWVDVPQSIIRRVDLPSVLAPAHPGQPSVPMDLAVEFTDATFSAPDAQPPTGPQPPNARLVSRLVPLPPAKPPAILGRDLSSLELTDAAGRSVLQTAADRSRDSKTSRPTNQPIWILAWVNDEPDSLATVAALHRWSSMLPELLSDAVRIGLVAESSSADRLPRELTFPVAIDRGGRYAERTTSSPGDLLVLDRSRRVAWIQPGLRATGFAAFGAIISDIVNGVDVPGRLTQQWRENLRAYHQELDTASLK